MSAFSFRNKDLELNRELRFSLKVVYGVGFTTASYFLSRFGFSFPFFSSYLNSYFLLNLLGLLNFTLRSETKVRRAIQVRIKLLKDLQN